MIYYWDILPCHVVWIYSWSQFCMGTGKDPSLRFFVAMHMKDQVLGNVFKGTFSDSFWHNLSLHPHCRVISQSTSFQIWNFLPSCWGCLLTLWLEICVPNDKFGFSGDNCKTCCEISLAQILPPRWENDNPQVLLILCLC